MIEYQVEILPEKFKKTYTRTFNIEVDVETPQTAVVTFFDADGNIEKTVEYG
jgi:hypothetical protein